MACPRPDPRRSGVMTTERNRAKAPKRSSAPAATTRPCSRTTTNSGRADARSLVGNPELSRRLRISIESSAQAAFASDNGRPSSERLRRTTARSATGRLGRLRRFGADLVRSVSGALAGCEKCLPLDALRIVDPALLAVRVAAGGLALLDHRPLGALEPPVDLLELCPVLDLDAQMLHTGLAFPLTDREIHSRILQHPLRIVRLSHGGRRREELRVEADRTVEVLHGDVDVQTFHALFLRKAVAARGSRSGPQASREAAAVLAQKPDERVHALEVRAVVEIATLAATDDEPGPNQPLEVKRQR